MPKFLKVTSGEEEGHEIKINLVNRLSSKAELSTHRQRLWLSKKEKKTKYSVNLSSITSQSLASISANYRHCKMLIITTFRLNVTEQLDSFRI